MRATGGESTNVPHTTRFRQPGCARWPMPRSARSPKPTGCTVVRLRGLPSALKRLPMAPISVSGTEWPAPEPPISSVSPSATSFANSSAVTTRGAISSRDAVSAHHVLQTRRGKIGIADQSCGVGELERLDEMQERPRALLAADHDEMLLMAVEVGEEDDAGLVELRRRFEDMPRQRHGRLEDLPVLIEIAARMGGQCRRRRRREDVEDAEQRVRESLLVAVDELGVIEIVAGVAARALRQTATETDFLVLVEQRQLDAVDLRRVVADDVDADVHRRDVIDVAPVTLERRVEHLAEPVDDHRLLHLAEDAVIDLRVVVGRLGRDDERSRSHQHDAAADGLDRGDLLLIGADHVVERYARCRRELIGADAGENGRTRNVAGSLDRAADQFERTRPVEAAAALRRIHGLGHAEAQVPEVAAVI